MSCTTYSTCDYSEEWANWGDRLVLYKKASTSCPEGSELKNNRCVLTSCPEGSEVKNNRCIVTSCPEGYELKDNSCLAFKVTCPNGTPSDKTGVTSSGVQCEECDEGFILSSSNTCIFDPDYEPALVFKKQSNERCQGAGLADFGRLSEAACREKCAQDPACNAFTIGNTIDGTCRTYNTCVTEADRNDDAFTKGCVGGHTLYQNECRRAIPYHYRERKNKGCHYHWKQWMSAGRLMAGWDTTASWVIDPKPGIDVTLNLEELPREWCEIRCDNRGSKCTDYYYDGSNICVLVGDDATCTGEYLHRVSKGSLFTKSCSDGFFLHDNNECLKAKAVCPNGTVTIDHPLSVDGEHCSECNTGYKLDANNHCVPFDVWCQHGTPTSHLKVTEDGEHCASCDTGSMMDKGSNVCRPFEVTCDFGKPKSHKNVTQDGENCLSCETGYKLDANNHCVPFDVWCQHGTPKSHMKVTADGEHCESCHTGYMMDPDSVVCRPFQVTCEFGEPKSHADVTEDGENCLSCDVGYTMDEGSNVCRSFEVTCKNGKPKSHVDVTQDGENCLSCDPGYTMDKGSVRCRKFRVTCRNGTALAHTKVTKDGENCDTCRITYTKTVDNRCQREEVMDVEAGAVAPPTWVSEAVQPEEVMDVEAGAVAPPTWVSEAVQPEEVTDVEAGAIEDIAQIVAAPTQQAGVVAKSTAAQQAPQACTLGEEDLYNTINCNGHGAAAGQAGNCSCQCDEGFHGHNCELPAGYQGTLNLCNALYERTEHDNRWLHMLHEVDFDPYAVMKGNFSNKAPSGWTKEEKSAVTFYHKKNNQGTWVRDASKEFGPFLSRKVTLYTKDRRGFIFSSGEYPCDDNGNNCAMKYQDQVESNIPFADWKHKRNVNNRRPVLGRAEEWKKLGCQANTKIETIDFSEFVVRLDCPAYSEDDLIEAGDTAPNEYFNYPSCQLGFKANSATTYMHNDRTDPSRMRDRMGQYVTMLHTPFLGGNENENYAPVESLSYKTNVWRYRAQVNEVNGAYSRGNVAGYAFHTDFTNKSPWELFKDDSVQLLNRKISWISHGQGLVSEQNNNLHLIPPSMKGWVWCEDIDEASNDTDPMRGYCTATHFGNRKDKASQSFGRWGEQEALKNFKDIKNWKYITDPIRREDFDSYADPEKGQEKYLEYLNVWDTRPMVNSLILKNDEAGIDGIQLHCSNQLEAPPISTLYTRGAEETAFCPEGKVVCHPEQITSLGVGLDSTGEVVESSLYLDYHDLDITKCPIRELTKNECKGYADAYSTLSFTEVDRYDRPSGCYMGSNNDVYFNSNEKTYQNTWGQTVTLNNDVPGKKLCPFFHVDIVTDEATKSANENKAFCCDANAEFPRSSHLSFSTNSNVNENLHYDFLCVNDTSARFLCDPDTGDLVNFDGSPASGGKTCADYGRRCEYVPIDVYRHGYEMLKRINPEGKQYYGRDNKIWGDNVGNNSTTKQYSVSCTNRGGVCGLAVKSMEVEAKHGGDGAWGGDNNQYWFESAKKHKLHLRDDLKRDGIGTQAYPYEGARLQMVNEPFFGTHRQDGQGITNVEVMCCDGYSALAIPGDNTAYESQLADTTYRVNKDDLAHLLGGIAPDLKKGCERMGGTWTGEACEDIPNDNPTGSWEQVNTMVLPVQGTYEDTNKVFSVKEGGLCCLDDFMPDVEGWTDEHMSDSEAEKWGAKLINNKKALFQTKAGFVACPFSKAVEAFGKQTCCSISTVKDGNGIDRKVMNLPALPKISLDPDTERCGNWENEEFDENCAWVDDVIPAKYDKSKCEVEECAVKETCETVVEYAYNNACDWLGDGVAYDICREALTWIKKEVDRYDVCTCPDNNYVCTAYKVLEAAKTVSKWVCDKVERAVCVLNEFTPELKCQTAQAPLDFEMDLPVRFRRTARYGHKAHGHVNVIPGQWTPIYGCRSEIDGTLEPLDNVIIGNNKQQRASDWRTKENNSNNPGPLWHSTGWGDQLGITSIGFICPKGTYFDTVGPMDGTSDEYTTPRRDWEDVDLPGQQPHYLFLPEYRQAGMFNDWMTTGTPNLYTSCSSKPHDTQKEQMDNVDDWHNQCGWYFEGWRRRNYNISKVDGDASTGGAWSEADLGVWGRYLNPRDKCFDAQKNKTSAWGGNAPTTETECKGKGGEWIAKDTPEAALWGYENVCVKPCYLN